MASLTWKDRCVPLGGIPKRACRSFLCGEASLVVFKLLESKGASSDPFLGKQDLKIGIMAAEERQIPTAVGMIGIKENPSLA